MKIGDLILLGGLGLLLLLWLHDAGRNDSVKGAPSYTTGASRGDSLDDCPDNPKPGERNSLGHVCGPADIFGFRKRGW
jgi:hypothetical protein